MKILNNSFFHVHTYRCGHAAMIKDETYVENAIKMKKSAIYFSDHAPFPENPFGNRMQYNQLEEYLVTLNNLKRKYANNIKIFVGLEIEYLYSYDYYYKELRQHAGLDFLLLGQHFCELDDGHFSFSSEFCDKNNEMYFLAEAIKTGSNSGYFDVIAHPDRIFRRNKLWSREMSMIAEGIVNAAEQMRLPLEKNYSSMEKKYHYWPEFWDIVQNRCSIITGCDAHSPEELR